MEKKKTTLARMLGVDKNITESEMKKRTSPVKVKFVKYDWSPHGVRDVKTFVRGDLRSKYTSVTAILS